MPAARFAALLFLALLLASCGDDPTARRAFPLGEYHQTGHLNRHSFALSFQAQTVDVWHSIHLGSGTVGGGKATGTWSREGDWILIEMPAERPYWYVAHVLPSGLEIWNSQLDDVPVPLGFPPLPARVREHEDPEVRMLMRNTYVSTLGLRE